MGFKAEEAFLEDSAVRMIRQSTKSGSTPFRYVVLDLDDNTIDLARFVKNSQAIAKEHQFTLTIIGAAEHLTGEIRKLCMQHSVGMLEKPLEEENLKTVLTKM
jgi:hypothetical protein